MVKKASFISFMIVFFVISSVPSFNPIVCNLPPALKALITKKPAPVEKIEEPLNTTTATQTTGSGAGAVKQDIPGVGTVTLELTYPVGQSPKVFTQGWVFGAKAFVNPGKSNEKDISEQVQWSGSGMFQPAAGKLSHTSFSKEGANKIVLTLKVGEKTITKEYSVQAVSPALYARVSWFAQCPADTHGCITCPHNVIGPIIQGSPTVSIDGHPMARVGDNGIHKLCCGPSTFVIDQGDPDVLIDGKPAARLGDRTKHCGGMGKITGKGGEGFILKDGTLISDGGCTRENDLKMTGVGSKLLNPIFSKVVINVDSVQAKADQTIPVTFQDKGVSYPGNAKVKMDGNINKELLSGTYTIDAVISYTSEGKLIPIDIKYSGNFKSAAIPVNPVNAKVRLTFDGAISSKALWQIIIGLGGALTCEGQSSTKITAPPPGDILCSSYISNIEFTATAR